MSSRLHYWGGAVAFWGCEKVTQSELSPKVAATQQLSAASAASKNVVIKQASWLRFINRVTRGEVVDPSGQYVAKGTTLAVDASDKRLARPKFDAAQPASAYFYRLDEAGEVVATPSAKAGKAGKVVATSSAVAAGTANKFADPCFDCGGGNPPELTTFITSEGVVPYGGADNPNGYIWDLKIGHGSAQGDHYGIPNSYTVLYSDLNKGAGGDFIYIGFSRVPSDMSNNPEVRFNNPYAIGPVTRIGIVKKYYFTDNYPTIASPDFSIWVDTGRPGAAFEQEDLNNNAGGWYIRSYQSKQYGAITSGQAIEVGVLSSNIGTVQPPSGWTIASSDLNEGAGGDYIYFCVKAR